MIFLKNIHFINFDSWFCGLNENEQDQILQNYGGLEKYLGIELVNETYDEEKGFEFKIVDKDRWTQSLLVHDFLNNL
jgi:hypothetical protein